MYREGVTLSQMLGDLASDFNDDRSSRLVTCIRSMGPHSGNNSVLSIF